MWKILAKYRTDRFKVDRKLWYTGLTINLKATQNTRVLFNS